MKAAVPSGEDAAKKFSKMHSEHLQSNVLYSEFCRKLQWAYLILAALVLYLIIGYFAELVCNFVGFAYPAYASVKVSSLLCFFGEWRGD